MDGEFSYLEWNKNVNRTLLCIHGYADNANKFEKLVKLLDSKYRVISLNLPMVSSTNDILTIQKLGAFVKKLCVLHNIKPDVVLGFSLGGVVALEYCHQTQETKKQLIMLNSLPKLFPPWPILFKIYKLIKPLLLHKTALFLISRIWISKTSSELPTKLKKKNYKSILGTAINALTYDGLDTLNKLPLHKKIILFDDDALINPKRYKKLINNIGCEILIIKNGGHAVKQDYWVKVSKLI